MNIHLMANVAKPRMVGFTIIDKAFVANGTIFIVSDQPTYVPNIHNMVSRSMVENGLVTIVSSITANDLFGQSVPRYVIRSFIR